MGNENDIIVIGSGIGGLVAASLLARYGKRVLVCESHNIPGGAAHSFIRHGFKFDSGPSFYCGLRDRHSLNPLRQVLNILGENLPAIAYDPLGHYHFPDGSFPVYGDRDRYKSAITQFTPKGAKEFAQFEHRLLKLYHALKGIPAIALRSDLHLLSLLLTRYLPSFLQLIPQFPLINSSVGHILDQTVKDPWVRRLIDLECFLLSGLKAQETIAPEVAFMLGERNHSTIDYPLGGSGAIVNSLVKGLQRWGGKLRLNSHVEQILIEHHKVIGIRLRNGEILKAPIVISNATIWDTYGKLLKPENLPSEYRRHSLATPVIESFMHLHLGIKAAGLNNLTGHHVVIHSSEIDLTAPGNTCMISIPSVWDKSLAPEGYHVIHAYTLEPYTGWQHGEKYQIQKKLRSQPLYRALEKIIPDLRDRIALELIGTPLSHAHYLRRYCGTYGPAIAAGKGLFPNCHTPISGLYRVGDSTLPGIGVPAVAASGILCANTLVSPSKILPFLQSFSTPQK